MCPIPGPPAAYKYYPRRGGSHSFFVRGDERTLQILRHFLKLPSVRKNIFSTMPKRSKSEKIEFYSAKIRKLQEPRRKKRLRTIIYSDSSDSENNSGKFQQYISTLNFTRQRIVPYVIKHLVSKPRA
ncbi:hypothetical protein JYU34_011912 [Plutella xylostella]|uniref:Uncharacterized protein n=1 Tax=Plutella xylostella TaxID=51655 RepID=A0ABQ7QDW3_PLUXY|nr:hypothetical protein JYU34_011912 [Plutella xylostella]